MNTERIKTFFNRFGSMVQMAINIVVFIIIVMEVFDFHDAVRIPYIIMAVGAFLTGIAFMSNRWLIKIVSFIVLVILVIFAGTDFDVNNVFVFCPFALGMVSQFLVFFRINTLDKGDGEDTEEAHH